MASRSANAGLLLQSRSVQAADICLAISCTLTSSLAVIDLLWGNEFPQPRYGQGALQESMAAVYKTVTGHELQR